MFISPSKNVFIRHFCSTHSQRFGFRKLSFVLCTCTRKINLKKYFLTSLTNRRFFYLEKSFIIFCKLLLILKLTGCWYNYSITLCNSSPSPFCFTSLKTGVGAHNFSKQTSIINFKVRGTQTILRRLFVIDVKKFSCLSIR